LNMPGTRLNRSAVGSSIDEKTVGRGIVPLVGECSGP
jgi:hypothetical protein